MAVMTTLSDEDRALLESIAEQIADAIDGLEGGVETVHVCTMPRPAIEIEYPDYAVTLDMSVYRYTEEDR